MTPLPYKDDMLAQARVARIERLEAENAELLAALRWCHDDLLRHEPNGSACLAARAAIAKAKGGAA